MDCFTQDLFSSVIHFVIGGQDLVWICVHYGICSLVWGQVYVSVQRSWSQPVPCVLMNTDREFSSGQLSWCTEKEGYYAKVSAYCWKGTSARSSHLSPFSKGLGEPIYSEGIRSSTLARNVTSILVKDYTVAASVAKCAPTLQRLSTLTTVSEQNGVS